MFETNILRTLKRNKTLSNDGFDLGISGPGYVISCDLAVHFDFFADLESLGHKDDD